MKILTMLFLLFMAAPLSACIDAIAIDGCELNIMEVFLPEEMRLPVENVRLQQFQYGTERGAVDLKIKTDELTRLRQSVNKIAGQTFKDSKYDFQVLLSFTLYRDDSPKINMHIADIKKEEPSLRKFYESVLNIKDFHSEKDRIYVLFHYRIIKTNEKWLK